MPGWGRSSEPRVGGRRCGREKASRFHGTRRNQACHQAVVRHQGMTEVRKEVGSVEASLEACRYEGHVCIERRAQLEGFRFPGKIP